MESTSGQKRSIGLIVLKLTLPKDKKVKETQIEDHVQNMVKVMTKKKRN